MPNRRFGGNGEEIRHKEFWEARCPGRYQRLEVPAGDRNLPSEHFYTFCCACEKDEGRWGGSQMNIYNLFFKSRDDRPKRLADLLPGGF
jgi:hypothetical protein